MHGKQKGSCRWRVFTAFFFARTLPQITKSPRTPRLVCGAHGTTTEAHNAHPKHAFELPMHDKCSPMHGSCPPTHGPNPNARSELTHARGCQCTVHSQNPGSPIHGPCSPTHGCHRPIGVCSGLVGGLTGQPVHKCIGGQQNVPKGSVRRTPNRCCLRTQCWIPYFGVLQAPL